MLNLVKNKFVLIYGVVGVFLTINLILITFNIFWFSFVPIIFLVIFLYLFAFDKLLLAIVFFIPLSVIYINPDWNIGIEMPTEPVLFAIMFFFLIRIFYENNYEIKITKHPVTIAVLVYLIWLFITSITSQLPIVSIKFFLAKLWFIVSFYFLSIILFKNIKNINRYIWLYTMSLIIVIGYTLFNHSKYNFNEVTSHWVMSPFFNDHTAYAASIAFLIPVLIYFTFSPHYKISIKLLSFVITGILIFAIVFSYTRAAWLSLAAALLLFTIILFKINYKIIILSVAVLAGFIFQHQNEIFYKLNKNKQQSSADIVKHVQSISNISNDASNLERINRWNSAIRMFYDNPILGTGPGTYQFLYAPYQHFKDKTMISTNAGDRGNAHSEYLGPLAESGFMGSLSFLAIVVTSLFFGFKNFQLIKNKKIKYLNLSIILGLITYLVHGVLNNFLDTDKASALFWGFIAMIVAINIYHRQLKEEIPLKITNPENK